MLGDLLRQTREQKNLSLDDVEKGTNIRKLYIKAIEDGNYDKLPGEVFLKGFIKTYGKFLGLDGQKLIEQYKAEKTGVSTAASEASAPKAEEKQSTAETTAPKEADKEVKQPENTAKNDKPAEKSVPNIDKFSDSQKYLETKNSSGNKKNVLIIAVIIIAIVIGAIAFLSSQGADETATDNQPKTEQTQQEQPQAQPQQPAPAPAPVSGSEVSAVFSQDCWTEVKVDGNTVLSETVKAGSTLNWKGNNQIEITVGNAGAVDVTFNGQPQGKMGDVGAVVTKSFAAPNAQNAQQGAAPAQPQQQPANAQPQQPAQQ